MQAVVFIIMILVCINFILKQTYRKWYSVLITAGVILCFVGFTWQFAIELSKSQIALWLSDSALMLDMAVVIFLDVLIQLAFCVVAARIQTLESVSSRVVWAYRVLRWFPGILIYPVMFCVLTVAMFTFAGSDFAFVAWSVAVVTAVAVIAFTYLAKWLLPEKDIRLELLYLTNILIALLSIIATVNGRTAVVGVAAVDWRALLGFFSILAVFALLGMAIGKRKIKNKLLQLTHK